MVLVIGELLASLAGCSGRFDACKLCTFRTICWMETTCATYTDIIYIHTCLLCRHDMTLVLSEMGAHYRNTILIVNMLKSMCHRGLVEFELPDSRLFRAIENMSYFYSTIWTESKPLTNFCFVFGQSPIKAFI